MTAFLVFSAQPIRADFSHQADSLKSISIPEVTRSFFGRAYVLEESDVTVVVNPAFQHDGWKADRKAVESWAAGVGAKPSLQELFNCLVSIGAIRPAQYEVHFTSEPLSD
jgi:hypothetical protein